MFSRIAVAVALIGFTGCGHSTAENLVACDLISGAFKPQYRLVETEGRCDNAEMTSGQAFQFDRGRFISPVGALATCSTTQSNCAVKVQCAAVGLDANLVFTGALSLDAELLRGTITFGAGYRGCARLVYRLEAWAE